MLSERIEGYIDQIGVSTVVKDRVKSVYKLARVIALEDIEDVFITEVKGESGRIYRSTWFFTANYTMEAKNFLTEDEIDIFCHTNGISYISVKSNEFDYSTDTQEINDDASTIVTFQGGGGSPLGGELVASGKNCKFLIDICLKYFRPNVVST